jgi:adenylate cyclase
MRALLHLGLILFLGFCPAIAKAVVPEPFRVVFIDDQSAEKFGGFPLSRRVLAEGIKAIATQKPRAIILKLFLDQPKDAQGDQALASALTSAPVVLEARIYDTEPKPNPMPDRFYLQKLAPDLKVAVSGKSGWLPLESFSMKACDIGFVDLVSSLKVPVVERYQNHYVKSLYVCALELALQNKAIIQPTKLKIGDKMIACGSGMQVPIRFPKRDDLTYISFSALLDKTLDPHSFTDKVVILGYDGGKIQRLQTPIGPLKAHRVFCYGLFDIYTRLER